jgi:hypothetical protein
MAKRWITLAVLATGVMVLAGCTSGSSGAPPAPAGSSAAASTTPSASSSPSPTPTVTTTVTVSPAAAGAQNRVATPAVKQQLVAAGAFLHGLPTSDFTGLAPGETYYAFDAATSTYWAGAGLVPSTSSQPAQVSVQDDGSYLLFTRATGRSWVAFNVGEAGIEGATCPANPPKSVLKVWGWKPGTCRPPNS